LGQPLLLIQKRSEDLSHRKVGMMRLANEVAIVTGAGSGIGRATAFLFAREGAKVVVADSEPTRGQETVSLIEKEGGKAIFVPVDVSKALDAERMVKTALATYGILDILVNNAGIYGQGDVVDTTEEEWQRILGVNLTGAFLCSKYGVAAMIETGGGAIVNVASEAGIVAIGNQVAYNVSKSGVIALTTSMALDCASHNIRVNCLCPGRTLTPLVEQVITEAEDPESMRRALSEDRPLNRMGRPEEIAAGILFLVSEECTYATGSTLVIDGGYTTQ
jgi:NAD(P)-dependent dehydrogenase (short-subunit alcohol dehydrogenase family)